MTKSGLRLVIKTIIVDIRSMTDSYAVSLVYVMDKLVFNLITAHMASRVES